MSAIHEFAYKLDKKIQIEELFTQLKPVKRKPRDISNTKDADATKSKRFKKEATIGESTHELKLLATDFGEKKDESILYLDYSLSEDMKYHNIPEVHEGEHTKVPIEEVEKDKMPIKL